MASPLCSFTAGLGLGVVVENKGLQLPQFTSSQGPIDGSDYVGWTKPSSSSDASRCLYGSSRGAPLKSVLPHAPTPSTATSRSHGGTSSPFRASKTAPKMYNSIPTAAGVLPGAQSVRAGGAQFTIIANVPYDTVRQDLVTEFRKFGRVELAMVVCDEASRHPHKEWTSTAGYAFVRFAKRAEAAAAIQAATMGLISIRGTRVRADWARKDSYAKRGRVSPAQGAPSIGPFGVPDGISLLQDSLNRANAAVPGRLFDEAVIGGDDYEWSRGDAVARADCNAVAAESIQPTNDLMLQALEHAFARVLGILKRGETVIDEVDAADELEDEIEDVLRRGAGLTSPYSNEFIQKAVSCEVAEALSPTSRGLLSIALADVISPKGFTDVSPMCKLSAAKQRQSPEDLLRLAMANIGTEDSDESGGNAMRRNTRRPVPQSSSGVGRMKVRLPHDLGVGTSTASDFSSASETEDAFSDVSAAMYRECGAPFNISVGQ